MAKVKLNTGVTGIANAIMRGYDEGQRRLRAEVERLREKNKEESE